MIGFGLIVGVVTVELYNPVGASTVDLASGELRVRAGKRSADVVWWQPSGAADRWNVFAQ